MNDDLASQRASHPFYGDIVMSRPDSPRGKNDIKLLVKVADGFGNNLYLVRDDGDPLQGYPQLTQLPGQERRIRVYGFSGEDLVSDHHDASTQLSHNRHYKPI